MVVQTLPQTSRGGFSRHLPDSQGEGNQPALLSDMMFFVVAKYGGGNHAKNFRLASGATCQSARLTPAQAQRTEKNSISATDRIIEPIITYRSDLKVQAL